MTGMKSFLLILAITVSSWQAMAQEVALDFTRTDCDGVEHHLFSELDEGKVVILDYVMLGCAPCIWATRNIDTIVQSYEAAHPGRVSIYSFSYESSFTCEQMQTWRNDGGFPGVRLFTDGAAQVEYYGGMGMPTIVVVGGKDHKVHYNSYGYTPSHDPLIIAAIDSALNYSAAGINELPGLQAPVVYPTCFEDFINVEVSDEGAGKSFVMTDLSGKIVLETRIGQNGNQRISVGGLPRGAYFGYLKGDRRSSGAVKLFRQ